jgi:thioesterase domain-containing protein
VQPRADLFERDPTLGWGALVADGITIIDITGYHSAHLQEPYVDELATKLQAAIVETRTAARPRGR